MAITKGFNTLLKEQIGLYKKYCHNKPIVMTKETYKNTRLLGEILHKAICYFVDNWESFETIMPMSTQAKRVLNICKPYPFKVGSYRTDYLFDIDNQLKIIEMTTRQPLNGFFISGITNQIGLEMASNLNLEGVINLYPSFLDYMTNEIIKGRKVCIIKGNERLGDFKVYIKLFETAGIDYHIIELNELNNKLHLLENAVVIEELNHAVFSILTDHQIETITKAGILNDFRNLFLIHDKRFFHVITNQTFLEAALKSDEIEHLQKYTIPSYSYELFPEVFENAYHTKEDWIIKPTLLGKGESIYAGCVTDEAVWKQLFDSGNAKNMIIQPLLKQRKFVGQVNDEQRDDFVVGTLLYFNENYFGPGVYRASSFIVTNQGDDRKLAQIIADKRIMNDDLAHYV